MGEKSGWSDIWLNAIMEWQGIESNEPIGKVMNGGHDFDPEGTHNQHSSKWPARVLFIHLQLGHPRFVQWYL